MGVPRQLRPVGETANPGTVLKHLQYQTLKTLEPETLNPQPWKRSISDLLIYLPAALRYLIFKLHAFRKGASDGS
jgi:hypothetical protein